MPSKKPTEKTTPASPEVTVRKFAIDLDDTVIVVGRKGEISSHQLPLERGFELGEFEEGELEFGKGTRDFNRWLKAWEPNPWRPKTTYYLYGSGPQQLKLEDEPASDEEEQNESDPEASDRLEQIRETLRESRALGTSARRGIEALRQRSA